MTDKGIRLLNCINYNTKEYMHKTKTAETVLLEIALEALSLLEIKSQEEYAGLLQDLLTDVVYMERVINKLLGKAVDGKLKSRDDVELINNVFLGDGKIETSRSRVDIENSELKERIKELETRETELLSRECQNKLVNQLILRNRQLESDINKLQSQLKNSLPARAKAVARGEIKPAERLDKSTIIKWANRGYTAYSLEKRGLGSQPRILEIMKDLGCFYTKHERQMLLRKYQEDLANGLVKD